MVFRYRAPVNAWKSMSPCLSSRSLCARSPTRCVQDTALKANFHNDGQQRRNIPITMAFKAGASLVHLLATGGEGKRGKIRRRIPSTRRSLSDAGPRGQQATPWQRCTVVDASKQLYVFPRKSRLRRIWPKRAQVGCRPWLMYTCCGTPCVMEPCRNYYLQCDYDWPVVIAFN